MLPNLEDHTDFFSISRMYSLIICTYYLPKYYFDIKESLYFIIYGARSTLPKDILIFIYPSNFSLNDLGLGLPPHHMDTKALKG